MVFIVIFIIIILFGVWCIASEKPANADLPNNSADMKSNQLKYQSLTPEEREAIAKAKIEKYRKDAVFEILWKAEKMMNDMTLYGNACDILKKSSLYAQLSEEEKKEYQFYRSKRINKNCKNEIYYSDYQNDYDEAAFEEELLREESMNKRNVVLNELKNTNDDYDDPYDIDSETDPFKRTEKIYALHEYAPEELDELYDEEYDLDSGIYESEQDSYEDSYDSDDNEDMNNYDNFDEEELGDYF